MTALLRIAGAAPFLLALFLNAFVDLGHKIAIQNTVFKIYEDPTQTTLMAIVNALILLPFVLLLSPAGFVGDRYPKTSVMRVTAWTAVALTSGITLCYYQGWFEAAFAMTFLLAAQSAFYSPAKYGYIKVLFGKEHLGAANGAVQAVTIVAILAGTVVFSELFEGLYGDETTTSAALAAIAPIGWLLIGASLIEVFFVYRLPQLEQGNPAQRFDWAGYRSARLATENIARLKGRTVLQLSILGLATFWAIAQVVSVAFQTYVESELGLTDTAVITQTIGFTGIGIVLGSVLAGRASRDHIETGLIPLGAGGVALGLWLLPGAESVLWQRVCFLFLGTAGALFIVPLNSLIQFNSGKQELGRVLAASNWFQNLAMVAFLVLTALLAEYGMDGHFLLVALAVVATAGGCYTVYKLPQSFIRYVLASLIQQHYRVRVQGLENLPSAGGVLLLGNHVSWVDWAIVQIACPRRVRFVMARSYYDKWYWRWLLDLMGCIPIQGGPSSRATLAAVAEALDAGDVVCLFPEGTITRTGHLAEFKRGYETAASETKNDVAIVPFYLRGLWGSSLSRSSKGLMRRRASGLKRDVIVAFGPALPKDVPADVLKRRVFDLSMHAWQTYSEALPTLPQAWIETVKRMGGRRALADSVSGNLGAAQALTGAICLARRMRGRSAAGTGANGANGANGDERCVGLLLPTTAGGALANMAALFAGKTLVNLNYTASDEALAYAIEHAEVRTVYTSRRFLDRLEKRGRDFSSLLARVRVVHLEDLRTEIGRFERIGTFLLVRLLPARALKRLYCDAVQPEDTAAILFSSGSEGKPKGVMLSHRNIMVNAHQVADALNVQDNDVILASLPLFHAFGLNAMTFMPLVMGIPFVCYPDPTDVLGVAKTVAAEKATLMCSTSSFLRLFIRNQKVHPLMLSSLRLVVAGAERLSDDVRDAFQARFGVPVYEGYGATETAPVAGTNLPDAIDPDKWRVQIGNRPGTIGMPLHGTSFRIVDPETFEELPTGEEGMILIGGPQVMQGYLGDPAKTEAAIKTMDGMRWFVSGDKGSLDEDGFLTIRDRYSRFAKIAGEMVSLGEVERAVRASMGEQEIEVVAVNVPDDKKGEAVVVLHEGSLDTAAVEKAMLAAGYPGLMVPARWVAVEAVPKLGSGKTDFVAAKALALAADANAQASVDA